MNNKLLSKLTSISKRLIDCPDSSKKHFSFLVIRNKVVSIGWNKAWKTHPLAKKYGYRFNCTHSELDCILNSEIPISDLSNCTMINIRLDSSLNLQLSKPCCSCQELISDFGIGEVWYSTNNDFVEYRV
jgi:deoxycytidylate deaminase